MNKPKLLLIGNGGHARSCIDVIEQEGRFEIAGFVGEKLVKSHLLSMQYPFLGIDQDLQVLFSKYKYAHIALGQIKKASRRLELYEYLIEIGFEMPVIEAPTSYVSPHSTLGHGSIVMHGARINAGVEVGKNCIINSGVLLEHDVRVGDNCHISTGAILNGGVIIGNECFIGSGVVIKEGVSVGNNCIIGMALGVRHSMKDNTLYAGESSK